MLLTGRRHSRLQPRPLKVNQAFELLLLLLLLVPPLLLW